ncbi:MAG TPA: hypothetical protein VN969_24510 [Streptosporangiaceae bacterium]|nr:hypothetical protein [Streptosporangiaceae bacterium]
MPTIPASLPLGALGLGGTWTDHAQEATAGSTAELELGFLAQDVYLILGGTSTLDVTVNGQHTQTIAVSGVPRLYTLYHAAPAEPSSCTPYPASRPTTSLSADTGLY